MSHVFFESYLETKPSTKKTKFKTGKKKIYKAIGLLPVLKASP